MYHRIEMIGYVGKDCELRYSADGKEVASFSVAVNEKYGDNKITTWYRVSVWGKLALACEKYVKSGMMVFVEGELRPDKETGGPKVFTRNDGTAGASYEVFAHNVRYLSAARNEYEEAGPDVGDGDNMPF